MANNCYVASGSVHVVEKILLRYFSIKTIIAIHYYIIILNTNVTLSAMDTLIKKVKCHGR